MGTFIGADAATSTTGAPAVPWANLGSYAGGDVAVAFVVHSNASTVTTPSGWTLLSSQTGTAAFTEIYTKVLTGSETGSQSFTVSSSSKAVAMIEVWRGKTVPTSAELGITSAAATVSTTQAVPAVAKAGTVDWITATAFANSTPPTTFTQPAGTTLGDTGFTTGGGAKCGGIAHSTASETDGNVGSGSWTRNNSVSGDWITFTVAMVDATTRITKTQATTWNVQARVSKTQATTWQVRSRFAKTVTTTWNTLARVLKTQGTTWNVAGSLSRIVKTISTSWDVRARVIKTQSTTWNVAGTLSRIVKTISTTWDVRARVPKTQATTWTVRTRLAKTLATTWNVRSMISEASWPAFIGHRGSDPGPEETLFAYDALYARSPNYWHEGDAQTLNDGVTQVGSHDDTIDRMYSSGPVSTGNISSMSPAQADATFLRFNTGFTGTAQQMMRLSAWVTKYGKGASNPAIGIWENKPGTDIADTLATFAGCQGTVVINCDVLADAIVARAAGFDVCYQIDTPNFAADFTPNGIKYLSINYTAMTGTIATQAIAAGVKVLMYTVNSTANRDSMLALFSDTSFAGFISNKPQTLAGTTRITKTQSTTWTVRQRVTKALSTTWNVRARLAKTQATSWDLRARVAKAIATTWNTRQRVTKAQSTSWNVASSGSPVTSRAKVWNGTAWIAKPVKVGVTWVTKTLKARSGGTWI